MNIILPQHVHKILVLRTHSHCHGDTLLEMGIYQAIGLQRDSTTARKVALSTGINSGRQIMESIPVSALNWYSNQLI